MAKKMNKLKWFGNDADGLSMVDVLAIGNFVIWGIAKTVQFVLSVQYRAEPETLSQLNHIMETIDVFMGNILMFYFGKKTLDTTVTKVGLLATKKYTETLDSIYHEDAEDESKSNG